MRAAIQWLALPAVFTAPQVGYAVEYFSLPAVQQALFPAASAFTARELALDAQQIIQIGALAGVKVRDPRVHLWEARSGGALLGYVFADAVLGKHELISYALALSPDGKVVALEIMSYNESYGAAIRNLPWREQFVGKQAGDKVKVNADIRNLSGATLSSVHVTDGVRRLLATYAVAVGSVKPDLNAPAGGAIPP